MPPTAWPLLDEILRIFGNRRILDTAAFEALADEYKAQAGRLVEVWNTRFVEAVYAELVTALRNGESVRDVVPRLQMHLDTYASQHGLTIFSGERWSPAYADVVFRTNTQAAYAGGLYSQTFTPAAVVRVPFWMFATIQDDRVRPQHAALDGLVFRKDDAAGRFYLPPIGFNCRCRAIMLQDRDIQEAGYRITSGTTVPGLPMKDANGNPIVDKDGTPRSVGRPPKGWDSDRVDSLVPGTLRGSPRPTSTSGTP